MSHESKIATIAVTAFSIIAFLTLLSSSIFYKLFGSLVVAGIIIIISFILYGFGCYRSVVISDKYRFCIISTFINLVIVLFALVRLVLTSEKFPTELKGVYIAFFGVMYTFCMILAAVGGAKMANTFAVIRMKAKMLNKDYNPVPRCSHCGKPQRLWEFTCKNCGKKRFSFKKTEI